MYKTPLIYIVLTFTVITSCKRQTFYNGGCYSYPDITTIDNNGNDIISTVLFNPLDPNELIIDQGNVEDDVATHCNIIGYNILEGSRRLIVRVCSGMPTITIDNDGWIYYRDYSLGGDGTGFQRVMADQNGIVEDYPTDYYILKVVPNGHGKYYGQAVSDTAGPGYTNNQYTKLLDSNFDTYKNIQYHTGQIRDVFSDGSGFLFSYGTDLYKYDLNSDTIKQIEKLKTLISSDIYLHNAILINDQEVYLSTNEGVYLYNINNGELQRVFNSCMTNLCIITDKQGDEYCGYTEKVYKSKGEYLWKFQPFLATYDEDKHKLRITELPFDW